VVVRGQLEDISFLLLKCVPQGLKTLPLCGLISIFWKNNEKVDALNQQDWAFLGMEETCHSKNPGALSGQESIPSFS